MNAQHVDFDKKVCVIAYSQRAVNQQDKWKYTTLVNKLCYYN